jgi:hypothetical protein
LRPYPRIKPGLLLSRGEARSDGFWRREKGKRGENLSEGDRVLGRQLRGRAGQKRAGMAAGGFQLLALPRPRKSLHSAPVPTRQRLHSARWQRATLLGLSGRQGKLEAIPACPLACQADSCPIRQGDAGRCPGLPAGFHLSPSSASISSGLDPDHVPPAHSSKSEPVFGFSVCPTRQTSTVQQGRTTQAGVGFYAHTYSLVIRLGQAKFHVTSLAKRLSCWAWFWVRCLLACLGANLS